MSLMIRIIFFFILILIIIKIHQIFCNKKVTKKIFLLKKGLVLKRGHSILQKYIKQNVSDGVASYLCLV